MAVTGWLFHLETTRFRLKHRRKPPLTYGGHGCRTRRHLPRLARALPGDWKQHVAVS
jgi:hypothetical protein